MKIAIGILVVILLALQQQIWFGQSGYFERKALAARQADQQKRTESLALRNAKGDRGSAALKSDSAAFEARARSELGMVRDGEVFYLIPESQNR